MGFGDAERGNGTAIPDPTGLRECRELSGPPLSAQPERNLVVVHYIAGNQGLPIVNEHHAPLEVHADFVGTLGELAQSAMLMRIVFCVVLFPENGCRFFLNDGGTSSEPSTLTDHAWW